MTELRRHTGGINIGRITSLAELLLYSKKYFGGAIPDNIKIHFLKEEQYHTECRRIEKEILGTGHTNSKGTLGYCLYDNKKDEYNVFIKDLEMDCLESYIFVLYHELAHTQTMPKAPVRTKNKKPYMHIGFEFWKEYIAQYEAVNRYSMEVGRINFLFEEEAIRRLIDVNKDLLYESVLYCELSGFGVDFIEEKKCADEFNQLIEILREIRKSFLTVEETRNISAKDLEKIGKIVEKILIKW